MSDADYARQVLARYGPGSSVATSRPGPRRVAGANPTLARLAANIGRPGTTVGSAGTYDRAGRQSGKAPGLFEQFRQVIAAAPGGLLHFAGQGVQTAAVVPHVALDVGRAALTGDASQFRPTSFGDFTNEYLPLADVMARSMAGTATRIAHPSRYARASEEGTIVGTVLEDVGNLALVAGPAGKALGTVSSAGAAGALGAELAATTTGTVAEAAVARGIARGARGTGIAGRLERAGATGAARNVARTGRVLTTGSRAAEYVVDQPFPALRVASRAAGERFAPLVESSIARRLGRPYEIARTVERGGEQVERPITLSRLAREALVGTKLAEGGRFLFRHTPEGQRFRQEIEEPAQAATLRIQQKVAEIGQQVIETAGQHQVGQRLRLDDADIQRTAAAGIIEAQQNLAQHIDQWTRAYQAADDLDAWAADVQRDLDRLFANAKTEALIPTVDEISTVVRDRLGQLPEGESAIVRLVRDRIPELYAMNAEQARSGFGGRRAITDEELAFDVLGRPREVLDVAVGTQRGKLERKRESIQKLWHAATQRADRSGRIAAVKQALADTPGRLAPGARAMNVEARLAEPVSASEAYQRGLEVQGAKTKRLRKEMELREVHARLTRLIERYEAPIERGAEETAKLLADIDRLHARLIQLNDAEARARARVAGEPPPELIRPDAEPVETPPAESVTPETAPEPEPRPTGPETDVSKPRAGDNPALQAQARQVADQYAGSLERGDADVMDIPRQAPRRAGQKVRKLGGEYDFLEGVSPEEVARLRRNRHLVIRREVGEGAAGDFRGQAPDQLAANWSHQYGRELSVDEFVELWVEHKRAIDALTTFARGRLQWGKALKHPEAYGFRTKAELARYVERLLQGEVDPRTFDDVIEQRLRSVPEDVAPWTMGFDAWADELDRVNDEMRQIEATVEADEFGITTPRYRELEHRLRQLVPDDSYYEHMGRAEGDPYRNVYDAIVSDAQRLLRERMPAVEGGPKLADLRPRPDVEGPTLEELNVARGQQGADYFDLVQRADALGTTLEELATGTQALDLVGESLRMDYEAYLARDAELQQMTDVLDQRQRQARVEAEPTLIPPTAEAPATPQRPARPMPTALNRAKISEVVGKAQEVRRELKRTERKLATVAAEAARAEQRLDAAGEAGPVSNSRQRHARALDEVDAAVAIEQSAEAVGRLDPEEQAAVRFHRRHRNEEGVVTSLSQAERVNRDIGRAESTAARDARAAKLLADRLETVNRQIAELPEELSRPVQAKVFDIAYGHTRTLNPAERVAKISDGDWIEDMTDHRRGRGRVTWAEDDKGRRRPSGITVDMGRGEIRYLPIDHPIRWAKADAGLVGALRRSLRGAHKTYGNIVATENPDGTYRVDASGVLGDILDRRPWQVHVRVAKMMEQGADAELAFREVGYALTDAEVTAIERAIDIDDRVAAFDRVSFDDWQRGAWMDAPARLGRLNEDLDWVPQEWHNKRHRTMMRFLTDRTKLMVDSELNVEAAPADWRPPMMFARRQIAGMLDAAERLSRQGNIVAAQELLVAATEIASNVHDLAALGLKPIHVTGGVPAARLSGRRKGIRTKEPRSSYQRETPFAPFRLLDVERTEANELIARMNNMLYQRAEQTYGVTPYHVEGLRDWIGNFILGRDRYPTADEIAAEAKAHGYVALREAHLARGVKTVDRIRVTAQQLSDAGRNYDRALTSGDEATIQRARFEMDEAQRLHERAKAVAPDELRAAYRDAEAARTRAEAVGLNIQKIIDGGSEPSAELRRQHQLLTAEADAQAAVLASVEEATLPRLVPEDIARELKSTTSVWDTEGPPGWKVLDRLNRAYKTTVLPFSGRWYMGNLVGNVMMAATFGGVSPFTLARNLKRLRQGGTEIRYVPTSTSMDALTRALASGQLDVGETQGARLATAGLTQEQRLALDMMGEAGDVGPRNRVTRSIGKVRDTGYAINQFIDDTYRSAVYLAKLEDRARQAVQAGTDPATGRPVVSVERIAADAMSDTLKAMGDYTNMPPWQRRWVRQLIPFWSWIRHSTQAAMRMPIESPIRFVWLMQIANLYRDPSLTPEELQFFGGRWMLTEGSGIPLMSISPFEDPFNNPILNPPSILRAASPVLKLGVAATTGLDLNRSGYVTRPPSTIERSVYGAQRAQPLARSPKELAGYAIGLVPMSRGLRDIFGDVTRQGQTPSRYGTGAPITSQGREISSGRTRLSSLASMFGIPVSEELDVEGIARARHEREARQR